jgi:hypothetical protein
MTLGTVKYLLVIEGVADQWVTDSSLVNASLGTYRRRNEGLSVEGASISEHLNLRDASTDVGGMTLRISAEDTIGLKCFAQRTKHITYLTADATAAATTFTVDKASVVDTNDYIHIGTEVCKVTNISDTTLTVTRQLWDTQQQAHYAVRGNTEFSPKIYLACDVSTGDRYPPPTLENRRCYLFRYAQGETSDENDVFDFSSTKDGSVRSSTDELIFRGVISQAPVLDNDGITWALQISSVTSLLEQEIISSTDEDEFRITGVYHSDEDCVAIITEDSDNQVGGLTPDRIYKLSGFKDDNSAFIDYLNSAYGGSTLGTNVDNLEFSYNGSQLTATIQTDASTDCNFLLHIISTTEGCTDNWSQMWTLTSNTANKALPDTLALGTTYHRACSGPDTASYITPWAATFAGTTGPRGWLGAVWTYKNLFGSTGPLNLLNVNALPYEGSDSNTTTNPSNRIHIESRITPYVSDTDALYIATDGVPTPLVLRIKSGTISPVGDTAVSIDLEVPVGNPARAVIPSNNRRYQQQLINFEQYPYPLNDTTIVKVVKIFTTATYLGPFLGAVVDKAPEANKGTVPFITGSDVNESNITGISFGSSSGTEYLSSRNYWFNEKVSLLEILQEECKLLGCCMKLDATGRLDLFRLQMPASTESGFVTVNTDSIITPYGSTGNWIRWSPGLDGVVNVIDLQYGYDYKTGDYSKQVDIVDIDSVSSYKNRGRSSMTIAPYSKSTVDVRTDSDEIKEVARRQLAFFASDYDVVEIPVTMDLMTTVYCGTKVKVTSSHIPNTSSGTRGVTSRPGLVIGRDWPLDASESVGKITVRLEKGDIEGGYAPACEVTTATNVSGNTWDLTVTENKYSPSGEDDNSYFSAGYQIKLIQVNDASPDTGVGTVSTVSDATTVRVALTATAPWGATFTGNYYMVFDALSSSPTSDQQEYVYIAESDGDLTGGDNNQGHRFK